MILEELKSLEQWICWRKETRDGKPTKIPYNPKTGNMAKTDDPNTWTTYIEAKKQADKYDGVGFVFTKNDNYVGIDLDKVINEKGEMTKEAKEIISKLNSYTEYSPSKKGFHIIVQGLIPEGGNRKDFLEMYEIGRYFTMTEDYLKGSPEKVEWRKKELVEIHEKYIKPKQEPTSEFKPKKIIDLQDNELIEKAKNAKNGDKFSSLWNGNITSYTSQSEADIALCMHLAFWTQGNSSRINNLFKQSGLYRKKWERKDYREKTISEALSKIKEYYDPNKKEGKKKKAEEEKYFFTGKIIDEDNQIIIEQIMNDDSARFCKYNHKTKQISYPTDLRTKTGEKILPITDEEVTKGAIHLPNKPIEYNSDNELDDEIKTFITKWLDIPKDTMQFALWNIKRSWVFERFHTLNYLRALGDTGMGKSRFLDTLGILHYKPIQTSGATTAAPIFRMIEKWRGTLIMDEADFKQSDENQDIIKIINQGYEKGRYVMRCDQQFNIQMFDPYCPKILATRKTFMDKALESRCITTVMKGTNIKKIPVNLNKSFFKEAQIIRNKLLMWRFKNYFKIKDEVPEEIMEEFQDLEPRVRQVTSSFLNLFINDKKQLQIFKRFVTKYQDDIIEERKNSFDGQIIEGIYNLIEKGIMDFDAKEIITEIDLKNKTGNLVNPRSISGNLKSLGFEKGVPKKVEGKTKRCIPIDDKHIEKMFKRYGYEVTKVTVVTEDRGVCKNNNNNNNVLMAYETPKNKLSRRNRIHRNNRNSVTQNDTTGSVQNISESQILGKVLKKMGVLGVLDHDDILGVIDDEQGESLIKKWCRNGDIFEWKPGRYRKL